MLATTLAIDLASAAVYVDLNAPGPNHDGTTWDTAFHSIQEGVNAATPGGEVWVADGTYFENVVMGFGVAIYGGFRGAEQYGYETSRSQRNFALRITTIDGNQAGSCVIMASGATVDGFTITHGAGTLVPDLLYGGVMAGGGILFDDTGPGGCVANCNIVANTYYITEYGGGICCVRDCAPEIRDNLIQDNVASKGGGGIACCCSGAAPLIERNVISGNHTIDGGGVFIASHYASETNGPGPVINDCTIECNDTATIHYSGSGGGVYCYNATVTITNCVLADNLTGDYGGGGVYCGCSEPQYPEPDHFVGCRATLSHNLIVRNYTEYGSGGGVYSGYALAEFMAVAVILTDNTISNNVCANSGSGGGAYLEGFAYVAGNTISNNTAYDLGGGLYFDNNSGRLFPDDMKDLGPRDVVNNLIIGNATTWDGGGLYVVGDMIHPEAPPVRTVNNTVVQNRVHDYSPCYGGGVVCRGAVGLYNNIIADNEADDGGGGILYQKFGDPIIYPNYPVADHNDVWGNSEPQYYEEWFWRGHPTLHYGHDPGPHDQNSDPCFVDAANGDFHLKPAEDSGCINRGWSGAAGVPAIDYDGEPRVFGNGVDIGADEYHARTTTAPSKVFGEFGWLHFSLPLVPSVYPPEATQVLASLDNPVKNRLYGWDEVGRTSIYYYDDFTDLHVGAEYDLWSWPEADPCPTYAGTPPPMPFQKVLKAGYNWIGIPGEQDLTHLQIRLYGPYEERWIYRRPAEDAAAPDRWLNWNWLSWNPAGQCWDMVNPAHGDPVHPWYGYHVYAEDDNVRIIFTKPQSSVPVPQGIVAYPGNGTVLVQWQELPDVNWYRVYRSDDAGGSRTSIGTTSNPWFLDENVVNGEDYFYVVKGYYGGDESDPSREVFATPNEDIPIVEITSPIQGATLDGDGTIQFTASGNHETGLLSVLLNGEELDTVTDGSPYEFAWNTDFHENGEYVLQVFVDSCEPGMEIDPPGTLRCGYSVPVRVVLDNSIHSVRCEPRAFDTADPNRNQTRITAQLKSPSSWTVEIEEANRHWTGSGSEIDIDWDGKDDNGQDVPDGYYEIVITEGEMRGGSNSGGNVKKGPIYSVGAVGIGDYPGIDPKYNTPQMDIHRMSEYSVPRDVLAGWPIASKKLMQVFRNKMQKLAHYDNGVWALDDRLAADFWDPANSVENDTIALISTNGGFGYEIGGSGDEYYYMVMYNKKHDAMNFVENRDCHFGSGGKLKWLAVLSEEYFGLFPEWKANHTLPFNNGNPSETVHLICSISRYSEYPGRLPDFVAIWVEYMTGRKKPFVGCPMHVKLAWQNAALTAKLHGAVVHTVGWPECEGDRLAEFGSNTTPIDTNQDRLIRWEYLVP